MDEFVELEVKRVLGGLQYRNVEGDVRGEVVAIAAPGRDHALEPDLDPAQGLGSRVFRRERSGGGFQPQPHLREMTQKFVGELAFQHPAQHIRIEQAPPFLGLGDDSAAGPRRGGAGPRHAR